jgi:tryptophan synthase beta chain
VEDIYNDYFDDFGGRYVAEILRTPLDELEQAWRESMENSAYRSELKNLLVTYAGRPTPLHFAQNATRRCGGAQIYIKLEGLANTGAHKINNALG